MPRSEDGALLSDPEEVGRRVVRMVTEGSLLAVDGSEVAVDAESVCLHGDSPGAVAMAESVRAGLEAAGVEIKAFAG